MKKFSFSDVFTIGAERIPLERHSSMRYMITCVLHSGDVITVSASGPYYFNGKASFVREHVSGHLLLALRTMAETLEIKV